MRQKKNRKLRTARREKFWTIEQAAEHIGVSPQAYGRCERGECHPQVGSLRLLCQAFEKTAAELGY